jgi:hypothetical protein
MARSRDRLGIQGIVSNSENEELDHLRAILRDVHKPRKSFAKNVMSSIKTRMGARIQKKAIVDRIEKPSDKDAA